MSFDRRLYQARGPRSRRRSLAIAREELTTPPAARPPVPFAALFLGRNPEPPPAPEDENQARCGYCGGAGCEACAEVGARS